MLCPRTCVQRGNIVSEGNPFSFWTQMQPDAFSKTTSKSGKLSGCLWREQSRFLQQHEWLGLPKAKRENFRRLPLTYPYPVYFCSLHIFFNSPVNNKPYCIIRHFILPHSHVITTCKTGDHRKCPECARPPVAAIASSKDIATEPMLNTSNTQQ